ncbi:MAG: hypothetical protein ABSE57_29130, partial [Bryobacteraceae bacterium]
PVQRGFEAPSMSRHSRLIVLFENYATFILMKSSPPMIEGPEAWERFRDAALQERPEVLKT